MDEGAEKTLLMISIRPTPEAHSFNQQSEIINHQLGKDGFCVYEMTSNLLSSLRPLAPLREAPLLSESTPRVLAATRHNL
jgi:hypothetical protein